MISMDDSPQRRRSHVEVVAAATTAAAEQTAAAAASAAAATSQYTKAHPFAFAVHVAVVAALVKWCAPMAEIVPTGAKWNDFHYLAMAYGGLRILRLLFRCGAFAICILRFLRRDEGPAKEASPFAVAVETSFETLWPTEDYSRIALYLYSISRASKMLRLVMESFVGYETKADFGICDAVSLGQGFLSRSTWLVGLCLGYNYFAKKEICDEVAHSPKTTKSKGDQAEAAKEADADTTTMHVRTNVWKLVFDPNFKGIARFAAIAWLLVSVAECSLLFHWEAGVSSQQAEDSELDAVRYTKEFFLRYKPNFQAWSFTRVIVGSWREPFYCLLLFPRCWLTLLTGVLVVLNAQGYLCAICVDIMLGAASYIFLTSAHHLQFLILCLLVSWECLVLQSHFEEFQLSFATMSSKQRVERHDELGKSILMLQQRLHPLIVYLISERMLHMMVDVAIWRCQSAPFTVLHYCFRHLVRLFCLGLVFWRIGRLNASVYEDLTGKVVHQLMNCHGVPGLKDEELRRKRWELKDWVAYLKQNEGGRRRHCLRVCSFQCSVRAHTVAFWTVTLVLLPLGQRILNLLPRPNIY